MRTLIGVIGASQISESVGNTAYDVGKQVMRAGYSLICGGLGGVMEAVCRGAYEEVGEDSGRIIGLLPGTSKKDANPFVDIVIPTGIGYARNLIIACSSDAVIAVSGGSGTLSEIAMAWQYGKPVIVIDKLPGISAQLIGKTLDSRQSKQDTRRIIGVENAEEAVSLINGLL